MTHGNRRSTANPWYPHAIEHATELRLPSGRQVRLIDAVSFVATKLVAYEARGARDAISSADLEDILTVIAGREELGAEIAGSDVEIRTFIGTSVIAATHHRGFESALASAAGSSPADQSRIPLLRDRIEKICATG